MHHIKTQSGPLQTRIDQIHDQMFDSIGYFFIKDLSGKFLYLNKNLLDAANSCFADFLGKTDYDSPWAKFGDMFKTNDACVFSATGTKKMLELTETHDGRVFTILSHKKPFYHDGEIIGLCGVSLETTDNTPENLGDYSPKKIFFDQKTKKILHPTPRQKQILFYLLKGFCAKEIANVLFISNRTVEHHIDQIRTQSNHQSTRELIASVCVI